MEVRPEIIVCGDNFIYLLEYEQGRAFVVDPGSAEWLKKHWRKRALI